MEITVNEAADVLCRSRRTIRYMIVQGRLNARRVGRQYLIDIDSLPLSVEHRQMVDSKGDPPPAPLKKGGRPARGL